MLNLQLCKWIKNAVKICTLPFMVLHKNILLEGQAVKSNVFLMKNQYLCSTSLLRNP